MVSPPDLSCIRTSLVWEKGEVSNSQNSSRTLATSCTSRMGWTQRWPRAGSICLSTLNSGIFLSLHLHMSSIVISDIIHATRTLGIPLGRAFSLLHLPLPVFAYALPTGLTADTCGSCSVSLEGNNFTSLLPWCFKSSQNPPGVHFAKLPPGEQGCGPNRSPVWSLGGDMRGTTCSRGRARAASR